MTYSVRRNTLTLKCDFCATPALTTTIKNGDQLTAMRELWALASRRDWTSTSERHKCGNH